MKTFSIISIIMCAGIVSAQIMPRPLPQARPRPVIIKAKHKNLMFRGISRDEQISVIDFMTSPEVGSGFNISQYSQETQRKFQVFRNDLLKNKLNFSVQNFQLFLASAANEAAHMDIDELLTYLLSDLAYQSSEDIKDLLDEMSKTEAKKKAMREQMKKTKELQQRCKERPCEILSGVDVDQLILLENRQTEVISEESALLSLRLQLMMERRQKAIEMLSNLMKKMSETAATIISNLK